MCYLLNTHGHPLSSTKVHQVNLSGKQFEPNVRALRSKRTRYMTTKYFFVGDVQKRQHTTLECGQTDETISNFLTKPVGGAKFRRFCSIIMNVSHDEYGPVDVDELMAIHNKT